ncbi:hypothetical protein ACWDAQ_26930, partial [Streptomyces sp. NPDC001139]
MRSPGERRAAQPGAAPRAVHGGPDEARREPQRSVLAGPGEGARDTGDARVGAVRAAGGVPNVVVTVFSFNKPKGRFNYEWQQFSLDAWKQ